MTVVVAEVSLHKKSNRRERIAERRPFSHLESISHNIIWSPDESEEFHPPGDASSMQGTTIKKHLQKLVYDCFDSMQTDVGAVQEKMKTRQQIRKVGH